MSTDAILMRFVLSQLPTHSHSQGDVRSDTVGHMVWRASPLAIPMSYGPFPGSPRAQGSSRVLCPVTSRTSLLTTDHRRPSKSGGLQDTNKQLPFPEGSKRGAVARAFGLYTNTQGLMPPTASTGR